MVGTKGGKNYISETGIQFFQSLVPTIRKTYAPIFYRDAHMYHPDNIVQLRQVYILKNFFRTQVIVINYQTPKLVYLM